MLWKTNTFRIGMIAILQKDFSGVVMVSKEINDTVLDDSRNILLGHVTAGRMTSAQMSDNQILETASPIKSTIRFNSYRNPVQVKFRIM